MWDVLQSTIDDVILGESANITYTATNTALEDEDVTMELQLVLLGRQIKVPDSVSFFKSQMYHGVP